MLKRFLIIILIALSACFSSSSIKNQDFEKKYWQAFYNNNNKIILLSDEIKDFNYKLFKNNKSLVDFYNLPKYIRKNKSKKFAAVIHKSNLRRYPSNEPKFEDKDDTHFDKHQYKELKLGEPVILLRTLGSWALISTYNVQGWVEIKNIAFFESYLQFLKYLDEENFVVVSEPLIKVKEEVLDMGVKLALIKEEKDFVVVKFPKKSDKGDLIYKKVKLPKSQIHIGYLAYTKRNLIRQAFKYLGTPYGWGGLYNGVDCSGFVLNVYSVFGFKFPRNSFQQQNLNNSAIIISSRAKLNEVFDNKKAGSLVFFPGHIMIYLGKRGGKHYIIHAVASVFDKRKNKENVMRVVVTDTNIIRKTGRPYKDEIASLTVVR
ncbi:MAG: NlpC/P60 family protein [Bdellovibrionota bacterium]